ncbi:TKL/TKL-ccin protein kinase [Coprinopsis cinerea okayama7|uniref:TKL/TKL-ccin protein kinase n=1 Tax=Coprinopsis cinerea (strain Okayama-7 / 130 / ATCC MYA-4618 / FGSC 9003) TaxID=240176 RepID=D6RPI6_COPC7|nr:TKL/TKL-ccin protein kinase [Coprinopsis cinerea okayama7\|eukprot:XP_002910538.1 TKL/TKL-ccin protein kinase [Coprinopsis cinerea okayama7\
MSSKQTLETLHRRLRECQCGEVSLELLHEKPATWIGHHRDDIAAICAAYSECYPILKDEGISEMLFPRTFILAAVVLGSSEENTRSVASRLKVSSFAHRRSYLVFSALREILDAGRGLDRVARLAAYRTPKDGLRRILLSETAPTPGFIPRNVVDANFQAPRTSLRPMVNELLLLETAHIAALVVDCIEQGPGQDTLFLKKDPEVDQNLIDLFQGLLDYPALKSIHPMILRALIHLVKEAALFPRCLVHQDVNIPGQRCTAIGSFGDVWKGDLRGQAVAVKVMRQHVTGIPVDSIIRGYGREAILWSQLHHPNVLPFYGIYLWPSEDSGPTWVCLLSPWMANGNLSQYLEARPALDRMPLVRDIARGLNYLHSLDPSFIHGDIKSNNILVTPSGTACLADFGLGRLAPDARLGWRSSTVATGGPYLFSAPELLVEDVQPAKGPGSHEVTPAKKKSTQTDVYAFACVVYEMYTGTPRFVNLALAEAYRAIISNEPCERPAAMPEPLWAWINRAWDLNPDRRPAMSEFIQEFDTGPPSIQYKWDSKPVSNLRSTTFLAVPPTPIRIQPPRLGTSASSLSASTITSSGASSTTLEVPQCDSPVEDYEVVNGFDDPPPEKSAPRPEKPLPRRPARVPRSQASSFLEDDIIIALMGPTGSGKSTFINCALNDYVAPVSHTITSCTKEVGVYGCFHPNQPGRRVFLVDTPGFESTAMHDRQTLELIAKWLKETYQTHVVLTGVLQFHSIADARVGGTKRDNLDVFRAMCGQDALKNVVYVSTGWEDLDEEEQGERRQHQLVNDYLAEPLQHGCRYQPFLQRDFDAAWAIIDLFQEKRRALKIQEEMVKYRWRLTQTSAYKALSRKFIKVFKFKRGSTMN